MNATALAPQRVFAIDSLAIWNQPFGRDRITGLWRDLPPRSEAKGARETAAKILPTLLVDADDSVRIAACRLAGEQKVNSADSALEQIVSGGSGPKAGGEVRAAALEALGAIDSPRLGNALQAALVSKDTALLASARKVAGKVSPALAVKVNALVLGNGTIREQQEALTTIAQQNVPEADIVLNAQMDLLAGGKLSPALSLDVLEAGSKRQDSNLKAKLAAFEQSRKPTDSLTNWRECLEGGDAKLGREIFFEKAETACLRCHKVKGEGGDVGPDLAGVAKKYDREYLLRSIVEPNATISPGYDNVMLTLNDGSIAAGILNAEDQATVTLKSVADGTPQKIEKGKIKERTAVPSAMPPGLAEVLGKRGLRDVVEYMAALK
jgi:quinoprotein glucose dehydrogenase